MPAGLTYTSATRVIAGTPTTAGPYTFSIQVVDDVAALDVQAITLSIAAGATGPTITTTTLPEGTMGTFYNTTIGVSGGTPPYTSVIFSGALPEGLSYNTTSRVISGYPVNVESQDFSVQVTDANTLFDQQSYTLYINLALPPSFWTVLTIDGVEKLMREESMRITSTVSGRGTFECQVLSHDGSYRPAIGDRVLVVENGVRIFGGYIDQHAEEGFAPHGGTAISLRIPAIDFNAYADRKFISLSLPAGTLKAALTAIAAQLVPFGTLLHPDQEDGPTVPALEWDYKLVRDGLDELSALTDFFYTWNIDSDNLLRMPLIGTSSADFSIIPASDTNAIGDIVVETARTELANRIFLVAGNGVRDMTDTFVGDGTTRGFVLRVPMASFPGVYVNGAYRHTGVWGVDTLFEWTYRASDNTVIQLADAPPGTSNAALTGSDTLAVLYAGQYPIRRMAEDVVSQATYGLYEKTIVDTEVFDPPVVEALAAGYLEQYKGHVVQTVRYSTLRRIAPGQSQTIIVPDRNINGTFLITDVETWETTNTLVRNVTAVSGGRYFGSWRDAYRRGGFGGGGGGGTSSGGLVGGSVVVSTGGFFPGVVTAEGGFMGYGRSVREGEWNHVTHNDANFLGDGVDGNWLVDVSDQVEYKTVADGKRMVANVTIVESRVPNAGVDQLQIIVPGTIVGYHSAVGVAVENNSDHNATILVLLTAEDGNTWIGINKIPRTDWSQTAPAPGNTTNLIRVFGQIQFEIA